MTNESYYVVPGVIISKERHDVPGATCVKILGIKVASRVFGAITGDIIESKEQQVFFAVSGKKVGKFRTREQAAIWLANNGYTTFERRTIAYCDGSYDNKTGRIGAGLVFVEGHTEDKNNTTIEKSWQLPYSTLKNVSGELNAALEAAKLAYMEGCEKLTIYHDFDGVSKFVENEYKGDNEEIMKYASDMHSYQKAIDINFVKVRSHSNDAFNEKADNLAKKAIE